VVGEDREARSNDEQRLNRCRISGHSNRTGPHTGIRPAIPTDCLGPHPTA
jgi:hypothetical protein